MTERHTITIGPDGALSVDGAPLGEKLTKSQEKHLRAIFSAKGLATKDFIMSAVYAGRDEPDIKIIDALVCHVRSKLGEHRVAIRTVWGRGFAPHPAYELAAPSNSVGLSVDAELFGELLHITGEEPDALVARLLKAEQERLWA